MARPPVRLSVTRVDHGKTAKPIEMPFGTETWVDTSNIVLEGGRDPPLVESVRGGGNFRHNGNDWQRKVQWPISR